MTSLAIAVAGAGVMGRNHIALIASEPRCHLAAVADPSPEARQMARSLAVPWFADIGQMLHKQSPHGVIIATPTGLHGAHGLAAIAARVPMLMEKPAAHNTGQAAKLCARAEAAGVAILVGHHRRHNQLVQQARHIITSGALGPLRAISAHFLIHKPDDYFLTRWHRTAAAGPVLTNLIHDIDTLRWLCGEITAVTAMTDNLSARSETEDTAAITLRFACGALASAIVSDAATAPWSWEMTARENPVYPPAGADCYFIAGAKAALAVPSLTLWRHDGPPAWTTPLKTQAVTHARPDPLARQLAHFCDVIEGKAEPLVPARDATATLQVAEAIHQAAKTGQTVSLAGAAPGPPPAQTTDLR